MCDTASLAKPTLLNECQSVRTRMGNIPLCVPKRGGPIVFTEGYQKSYHAPQHLPLRRYHPYKSSLENLVTSSAKMLQIDYRDDDDISDIVCDDENKSESGLPTLIFGLELEQDSVCSNFIAVNRSVFML